MDLVSCLARARELGFLGPGPVEAHVQHADRYLVAVDRHGLDHTRFLDLGSGAGIPGLVLAERWPQSAAVLLDSSLRRCEFLRWAVRELDLEPRVTVVEARAEEAGHGELRAQFPLVVARAFARSAVVSECAAGFLTPGGYLVVSEPPPSSNSQSLERRWPATGLELLGQELVVVEGGVAIIRQVDPCPDRFPRRTGIPAKRPLF